MESFYIVATPIGNLEDITYRAIKILQLVDFIVCEDTRVSNKLLKKYAISKPMIVYNDHSNDTQRQKIINFLQAGKKGALISDAGTPLISDPGYKLIRTLRELKCKIIPVPGASSIITALSVGNLPTDKFLFLGYLPPKIVARKKNIEKLIKFDSTIILLETSKRLLAVLVDIYEVLGNRKVTIARELTKLYEEIITLPVAELIEKYKKMPPKGEIVVLVEGANEVVIDQDLLLKEIKKLAVKHSVKDVSNLIAKKYNISKKLIYDLAKKL